MFSKLAVVFISVATFVAAANKCNVGELNCCKSVQKADSTEVTNILGSLDVAAGSITGSVGLNCSPITALAGATGSNCNAQPACCNGNNVNGILTLDCSPINAPI